MQLTQALRLKFAIILTIAAASPVIGYAERRQIANRQYDLAQLSEPAASSQPSQHRPGLGAIGQRRHAPQADAPAQSTLQPSPPVDRNSAYFNRPGAIPRSSFQPINNNAPIVKEEQSQIQAAPPARPVFVAPKTLPVAPQTALPRAPQAPQGQLIRPAPLGQTHVLRERTRLVPSIIVPTAKVFPAHGPQSPRKLQNPSSAPGPTPLRVQTLQGLRQLPLTSSAGNASGSLLPNGISAPGAVPAARRDIPNSRASPTELGSLPTVNPRPRSIMEGRKTPQKQCPAGLATC